MDNINDEEMKEIGKKIEDGTATKDEVVKFLSAVNTLLTGLKKDLGEVKK